MLCDELKAHFEFVYINEKLNTKLLWCVAEIRHYAREFLILSGERGFMLLLVDRYEHIQVC
jgi:hypothetical protein